jgi:putative spermidine/putrescine transport system substrate-binding protein
MKKIILINIALLALASLLITACAQAQAPVAVDEACDWDEQTCEFLKGKDFGGRTLVVGVWGGDIERIYREQVIPEIEKHNGRVELLLGGTGDRTAKIYAERGNPTMDVAYLNMYEAAQGVADGVLEPPSNAVPAYGDLYPQAQQGGYGMSFGGIGIAYNPDFFETPPDWEDLWNPEFNGKIGVATFPGADGEALLAVAGYLAGANEEDADAMFTKMAELKPLGMVYTNLDEVFMLMDKGDIVAAPMISGYAWTYIDRGMNITFSWPKNPGTIQLMDTLTIVKDTKNQDMAYAWAQLSLSPRVQKEFASIYFGPTNSKVTLEGLEAERCIWGDKVASLLRLSTYITDNRDTLTNRWNREILGN